MSSVTARRMGWVLTALLAGAAGASRGPATAEPGSAILWQIGKADHDDREFALAPDGYARFQEDGFLVVGQGDARRDWPYVQPGPADAWAGGRQHTFTLLFGVKSPPAEGECRLRLDLLDTQNALPPRLRVEVNGRSFEHATPGGAGDASVFGDPTKAKEHHFEVAFPANLLRAGANEIGITTLSGSWILYDALSLEAPAGTEPAPVQGTVVHGLQSRPVLVEKNGKLFQTVEMSVRHLGDEADAVVRVSGAEPVTVHLRPGPQRLEVPVPAVSAETKTAISIEAGGKTVATQEQTLKPVRKWVVYLLPHSHVDIGYTQVQTEVEQRQWGHIEQALQLIEQSAANPAGSRFKWNTEVLWAVDSYLRQASPEKQQAFLAAVKAGSIGLDALYGNELTGLCRPEELMRLFTCAAKLQQRTGVPIDSAMISDVPGSVWGIVSAMGQMGVRYYSMGVNYGDRIGFALSAWEDKPFYWVGPDGRHQVLCWTPYKGYALGHSGAFKLNQSVSARLQQLEEAGYPYDIVQLRWNVGGDNGGPDTSLAQVVKEWNAAHAYPKLVIATTSEAFHAFEQRYGAQVPRFSGDFTPYWEDGAASSAHETALNRQAADRLVQTETLWALLKPRAFPADAFSAAWRDAVLYDEHTWGAHCSISQPDNPFTLSQWKIKQAFALGADAQSRRLLTQAVQAPAAGAPIAALDVFNTSSWTRSDLVTLPIEMAVAGDVVKDGAGKPVPSQRLAGGELAFLAKAVPPFGARRYTLHAGPAAARGKAKAAGSTLSNGLLTLRLDEKTGAIASLKAGANELVDRAGGPGLNEYLYVAGRDPKAARGGGPVTIRVQDAGPLVASLRVEGSAPGCKRLVREVRVVDGLGWAELTNVVDKQAVRAKEGVHFAFPFRVPAGTVRLEVPWAVIRPEADQIPGACKNWFSVQRWADVSNRQYGVTLATPDAPMMEVGSITAETPWMAHIQPSQRLFSYVMNNYWHTNYKADQEGPTLFRYAIRPHRAYQPAAAARWATERSQPLLAVPAIGPAPAAPRLRLSSDDVLVTALKPSDDGKALIVRLYGAGGKPARVKLTWSAPAPASLWQTDLTERPLRKVVGPIDVPAWGVVTLRAE